MYSEREKGPFYIMPLCLVCFPLHRDAGILSLTGWTDIEPTDKQITFEKLIEVHQHTKHKSKDFLWAVSSGGCDCSISGRGCRNLQTMGAAEVGGFRCREERPRRNFSGSHDKKEKEGQSKGDQGDETRELCRELQYCTVCWAM